MKLTLCYAPNTCALVPYVTLTEAGAEFDVKAVNFGKGEHHTPEYLGINPMHKVPVLVIDGQPLTENVAIQTFIARAYPAARLLPADPMEEIRAISFMAWCASGVHPFLSRVNNPPKVCAAPGSADSVKALAMEQLAGLFRIADDRLAGRDYVFGEFTAPDAYFFWCFRRAGQLGVPLSAFDNCNAHFARMQERPSVQKLLAFEKEVKEAFAKAA